MTVSLAAGVAIGLFAFPAPKAKQPSAKAPVEAIAPVEKPALLMGEFLIAEPSALKYLPPLDRNPDMQMFDRAVLFLIDSQEADGHWDSARTLAGKEFQNTNGDIALTGIAAYVLMCASTATNQNPAAVARAAKAMRWLESKLNTDGTVGDLNGPGEQTIAQFMAGSAFFQAASMSTRESLRKTAGKLMSVALLKMKAKNGGYGPSPDSADPRADVLALAAFVYKSASLDGYQFDQPKFGGAEPKVAEDAPRDEQAEKERFKKQRAAEEEVVETLRSGFRRLEVPMAQPEPKKTSGVFAPTAGGKAEWNATVACMLANFLINPQRSSVTPALDFTFGELDAKTEGYPRIPATLKWGEKGEGYSVLTSWFGTMAVVYLFTDDKPQHKTWTTNLRELLKKNQLPDGGWAVAGEDARRGRVWRTAFHAMTLILIAPPPPPPAPPADTINTPAVPEAPGAKAQPAK